MFTVQRSIRQILRQLHLEIPEILYFNLFLFSESFLPNFPNVLKMYTSCPSTVRIVLLERGNDGYKNWNVMLVSNNVKLKRSSYILIV